MLTIYTKNHCPYCTSAKTLLKNRGLAFEEINIEQVPEAKSFLVEHQHRTVPQIYYRGRLFVEGGYTGLSALNEQDILKRIEEFNADQSK
jgi:glutaredoxin 3